MKLLNRKLFVLSLLLGMVQGVWAETTISWADHIDASWGSDYSTANAFTISTPAQLAKFAYMVSIDGKNFKSKTVTLTEDIDLSAHYWNPIGGIGEYYFSGNFDGAGHTIRGMKIINDEYQYTDDLIDEYKGLFGYINNGARIKNLKITNSSITTVSYITGAIVGYAENCIIENCSVDSSVDILSNATQPGGGSVDIATGGLVGRLHYGSAELYGCVCGASVSGREKVGGLVGEVVSAHVVACLYTGSSVVGGSSTTQAALFGNINGGDYLHYNLYTDSKLDDKNGQDVRGYVISLQPQAEMSFDFGTPTTYDVSGISCYTYTDWPISYSCIAYGGSIYCAAYQRIQFNISPPLGYVPTNVTASAGTIENKGKSRYELYTAGVSSDISISASSQLKAWNGDGIGTEADPYLVKTPDDLRWIAAYVNAQTEDHYSGKYFQLANDIEFDGTENNFTPIGSSENNYFAGIFDGQGHTISGININASGRLALFATVKKATIRNLTLANSNFINTSSISPVGGIVASISNGVNEVTTIENCHVTNSVNIKGKFSVGGIASTTLYGESYITGCSSAASVETTGGSGVSAGGIIGKCGYEGNSSNFTYVTISNCLYHGKSVSGEGSRIAAIVGSYITNGYSTVTLSNNFYTYSDASVKGIGYKKETKGESATVTTEPFDLATNHGAVRVHPVTSDADKADMGTAGTPVENGITPYTYGVKYGDTYYSHVLALPDDADLTPLLEQYDGQTFDVKLRGRRLYKDGDWNTLCLPFTSNLTAPLFTNAQEYTIMELDVTQTYYLKDDDEQEKSYKTGVQDGTLYLFFKEAKSISAGTPYIVKWERVKDYNENDPAYDYQDPVFANVTISKALSPVSSIADDGKLTFQSTYAPIEWGSQDRSILFLGAGSTLSYPQGRGAVSIGPCRAYFQLNGIEMEDSDSGGSGGGDVKAFVLNISDGETGITATNLTNQTNMADAWYTIDGRRLDKKPAQRGLYINKGKKVVIK